MPQLDVQMISGNANEQEIVRYLRQLVDKLERTINCLDETNFSESSGVNRISELEERITSLEEELLLLRQQVK